MNRSAAWSLIAAMGSFAFVAAGATNTFEEAESTTLGECPTGWTGYCAVSNQVGSYETTPPGNPVLGVNHDRVLWVEGSAARTYDESGNRVVDLLVMAEEWPDEELPAADGNEQIKFAFDTNGCVNLYHKLASGDAAAQWRVVSSNAIPAGTWVRTTFTFDYANHICQLKLNGSPCVSEYGYRSADNLTHPGSWYYMAKSDASSLASIDFVGCGGVDDVINPEKQIAEWAAIRYASDHSRDYIKLDGSHAIFEVTVPEGWVGRTVGNIDIRKKYGISILAIKRDGKMSMLITPETQLDADMTMLVLGDQKAIQKCFKI